MENLLKRINFDSDKQLNIVILEKLHSIEKTQQDIKSDLSKLTDEHIKYVIKTEKLETAFKIKSGTWGIIGGLIASISLYIAKILNS